jgi:hypothetical protein
MVHAAARTCTSPPNVKLAASSERVQACECPRRQPKPTGRPAGLQTGPIGGRETSMSSSVAGSAGQAQKAADSTDNVLAANSNWPYPAKMDGW